MNYYDSPVVPPTYHFLKVGDQILVQQVQYPKPTLQRIVLAEAVGVVQEVQRDGTVLVFPDGSTRIFARDTGRTAWAAGEENETWEVACPGVSEKWLYYPPYTPGWYLMFHGDRVATVQIGFFGPNAGGVDVCLFATISNTTVLVPVEELQKLYPGAFYSPIPVPPLPREAPNHEGFQREGVQVVEVPDSGEIRVHIRQGDQVREEVWIQSPDGFYAPWDSRNYEGVWYHQR